jgi:hypothetical protein
MRIFTPMLLALALGAFGSAQATTYYMTCKTSQATYKLVLDDDAGTLVATLGSSETHHVFRSLRKENGTVIGSGFVKGRGTDFEFIMRYEPSISYAYGNGGKRTDQCKLDSQR